MAQHRPGSPSRHDWCGVIIGALAILLGSSALGLVANEVSPRGIPIFVRATELRLPLPKGVTGMDLAQAKAVVGSRSVLVLDAREPEEYAAGHLPGALSLPVRDFERHFLDLADTVTAAPQVMVYCASEDCGDGIALTERLKEAYQGKIFLFEYGWRRWSEAGYPVTKGGKP